MIYHACAVRHVRLPTFFVQTSDLYCYVSFHLGYAHAGAKVLTGRLP